MRTLVARVAVAPLAAAYATRARPFRTRDAPPPRYTRTLSGPHRGRRTAGRHAGQQRLPGGSDSGDPARRRRRGGPGGAPAGGAAGHPDRAQSGRAGACGTGDRRSHLTGRGLEHRPDPRPWAVAGRARCGRGARGSGVTRAHRRLPRGTTGGARARTPRPVGRRRPGHRRHHGGSGSGGCSRTALDRSWWRRRWERRRPCSACKTAARQSCCSLPQRDFAPWARSMRISARSVKTPASPSCERRPDSALRCVADESRPGTVQSGRSHGLCHGRWLSPQRGPASSGPMSRVKHRGPGLTQIAVRPVFWRNPVSLVRLSGTAACAMHRRPHQR